mmetsp:Transcript_30286/g.71288  ORF Transcript_30286/g.71288 Transcript_30286/m.71288 type:complete len:282 (-) Transcript_30286:2089-2934(-)
MVRGIHARDNFALEVCTGRPQNGRAVGSLDVIHALQTIDSGSKALQEMLHHLQRLPFAVLQDVQSEAVTNSQQRFHGALLGDGYRNTQGLAGCRRYPARHHGVADPCLLGCNDVKGARQASQSFGKIFVLVLRSCCLALLSQLLANLHARLLEGVKGLRGDRSIRHLHRRQSLRDVGLEHPAPQQGHGLLGVVEAVQHHKLVLLGLHVRHDVADVTGSSRLLRRSREDDDLVPAETFGDFQPVHSIQVMHLHIHAAAGEAVRKELREPLAFPEVADPENGD